MAVHGTENTEVVMKEKKPAAKKADKAKPAAKKAEKAKPKGKK